MSRNTLLLALLGLALSNSASAADTLRVMSFNVRTPVDTEPAKRWDDRRDSMVELIRQQAPAVIGTQELVKLQGDYLVQKLPHYHWFGEGRRGGDEDEHMGVLYDSSRLQLLESGRFWLSDTPEVAGSISWGHPYPRMATWGLFERLSDHQRFYLLDTHLPYRSEDEPARVKGAELIVQRLQQLPANIPVVVTGDFNSEPDSPTHQAFTRYLQDARMQVSHPQGPRLTFHDFTGKPTQQLDWILVKGLKVKQFSTLDQKPLGVLPSDHFPVEVDLELP